MSTQKVASDPSYHVGTSTDVTIASTPASLYFENSYTSLPPSCIPSNGAIQRTDIFNTASVRGLATNFDLVIGIRNSAGLEAHITHITKCWQWIKLYFDDVQVCWLDDVDCAYLCTTRNLLLQTNSENDYRNLWVSQGCTPGTTFKPWSGATNIVLEPVGSAPNNEGVCTIPLDYVFSNTLHKFDTALVNKISIEVKWRAATGDPKTTGTFISNGTGNTDPWPTIQITDSFVQQRLQLYTDQKMFKPLSQMYVKPMIKVERQVFKLSREVDGASVTDQAKAVIKLSDSFSYHKRILGLCLALTPKYTTYNGIVPGQMWMPAGCGAVIRKGGKELEQLLDIRKFDRQANHFLKCLGAQWIPPTDFQPDPLLPPCVVYNANCGNFISFLDKNLMEGHTDMQMLDKIQLVAGISNDLSEAWSVEINLFNTLGQAVPGPTATQYSDELQIYMIYTELLGLKAQPGRGAQVKIFS